VPGKRLCARCEKESIVVKSAKVVIQMVLTSVDVSFFGCTSRRAFSSDMLTVAEFQGAIMAEGVVGCGATVMVKRLASLCGVPLLEAGEGALHGGVSTGWHSACTCYDGDFHEQRNQKDGIVRVSWRGCFDERDYRGNEIKFTLGDGGSNVWYRGQIKDIDTGIVDAVVVALEADLTSSVLASNGGEVVHGLDGQWVRVHRVGYVGTDERSKVFGRVLRVIDGMAYVMDHGSGDVEMHTALGLDDAVVDEEVVVGQGEKPWLPAVA
jgi:hypothetical protein